MLADKTNMEEAATYYSRSSRSLKRFFSLQDGNRKKIKKLPTSAGRQQSTGRETLWCFTFKHSVCPIRLFLLLKHLFTGEGHNSSSLNTTVRRTQAVTGWLPPPEAGRHKTLFSSTDELIPNSKTFDQRPTGETSSTTSVSNWMFWFYNRNDCLV